MRVRNLITVAVAAGLAVSVAGTASAAGTVRVLPTGTRFYVDLTGEAAQQSLTFARAHDLPDALLLAKVASWPVAHWLDGGTPDAVRQDVSTVEVKAKIQRQVPVLVAYDVPGRDCSQYSAGGAQNSAEYAAWIDGVARGIGRSSTVVVLEPDGLALSPDQCGGTADQQADRNAQISAAVTRLEQQPGALVYIDGGHSAWHAVGDMAQRLIAGGIADAQGFFLNVSNYQSDADLAHYGTMVSKCVWYLTNTPGATADDCANQYWPPADADAWYASHVPADATLSHFVTDTSRNGQGPWSAPAGTSYPDPQTWCDPPDRGLGARPTADTGVPLLDAQLWIKVPGESDGSCTRGTAGPGDPVYDNTVDPAAGAWWPSQIVGLATLAQPPVTFNPAVL